MMKVRKIITVLEDTIREESKEVKIPLRKVAVTAICSNPCSGKYVEDLSALVDGSEIIGNQICGIAAQHMSSFGVSSYGKGAVVGFNGSIEHAEAVLTTVFGDTMRAAIGGGKAWICHMAKRGGPNSTIDIPLGHKDALTIRSHYDAMTVTIPDGPLADEIAITCVFSSAGRPNHRIGGHSLENMIGEDGLR